MMWRSRGCVRSGFTLVEMLVVMGVVGILLSFTTVNLINFQRRTHVQTSLSTILADIAQQRSRAMNGDTQGRETADAYGIYFQTTSYTLFHGNTYSAGNPDNVIVAFENPIAFASTTFPNSQIVFSKGSGEVAGFQPSQNTVTFVNTSSNEQTSIQLNVYGTVSSGSQ